MDQTLHRPAVETLGAGAPAEVVDGLVGPVLLPFRHQGTDRALTHRLYRSQADPEAGRRRLARSPVGIIWVVCVACVARVARVAFDDREEFARMVDVRQ